MLHFVEKEIWNLVEFCSENRTIFSSRGQRLIKRFPPVPSSRNIGGRFLPPPGRCSRDRCGEKCARARHRARTLVTRTSGRGPQAQIAETGRDTFAGLRRTPRASSPSGRLDSRLCRGGGGGGQSNGVQAKGHVYSLPLCIYI